MRLRVLGRYTNTARQIDVYAGQEIEVRDELGRWLLNDAPGTFQDPSASKEEQARQAAGEPAEPYSMPPDGTTLPIDPLPNVVDGPPPQVTVVHEETDEERERREKREAAEEARKRKAAEAPAKNKAVQAPAEKK